MKRLVVFAMMTMLLLCTACSKEEHVETYAINSFDDIPDAYEYGLHIPPELSKVIAEFVFAQPDNVMVEEIEKIVSECSTDEFEIIETECQVDNDFVHNGKRAATDIAVKIGVMVEPDIGDDGEPVGIKQKCEEWMRSNNMRSKLQYNLRVFRQDFMFVNKVNGRSLVYDGDNYLSTSDYVPVSVGEQRALDIINEFITDNTKDKGDKYVKILLGKLGVKNDELYLRVKLNTAGVEEDEIEEMFRKLSDELKNDKSVREYMGDAELIRVMIAHNDNQEDYGYGFVV